MTFCDSHWSALKREIEINRGLSTSNYAKEGPHEIEGDVKDLLKFASEKDDPLLYAYILILANAIHRLGLALEKNRCPLCVFSLCGCNCADCKGAPVGEAGVKDWIGHAGQDTEREWSRRTAGDAAFVSRKEGSA